MREERSDLAKQAIARHEAALQVLRDSDEERSPLVVYLRKFDIHIMHGPTEPERQLGEEMVLDALPKGARILTIQEQPAGEQIRSTFSRRVPALWLGEGENWKSILGPILARAEMIISEFTFLSEGVRWELETCRALRKHHQTVLILPPRGSPFACLDHLAPIDEFPRVIWADQLFRERISENFVLRDLIGRIDAIGALPLEDRKRFYAEGSLLKRIPILYEGVLAGYKARARDWEARKIFAEPDDARHIDYYRFWDCFRIASVLGVLVKDIQHMSMEEAAFDLASAYIEMLQGISHGVVTLDEEGSFLTTQVASKIAGSLRPLIGMLPEGAGTWMLSRYADLTLERLGYPPDEHSGWSPEAGECS